MGLNGGMPSVTVLCTLQRPCNILGWLPCGLLRISMSPKSFKNVFISIQ